MDEGVVFSDGSIRCGYSAMARFSDGANANAAAPAPPPQGRVVPPALNQHRPHPVPPPKGRPAAGAGRPTAWYHTAAPAF